MKFLRNLSDGNGDSTGPKISSASASGPSGKGRDWKSGDVT